MDVSITIVNWNAAGSLAASLRSVYATPPELQYEVVVVDNGSEETVDGVVAQFPEATWIRNQSNVGFGRAQNQAVATARGRYVVLLNNDAMVEPDTIPTLVSFMDRNPGVACCGCPDRRQFALAGAYAGAFRRYPSLLGTTAENLWALLRPPRTWDLDWLTRPLLRWTGQSIPDTECVDVAWVVGALLCVRKEVFERIGGFDEGFFLFDEDIDLCRRVQVDGWKVGFLTTTRFVHEGGVSSSGRADIEKIRGASRALYFRKYHGRVTALLFRLQHAVLRQGLFSLRRRLRPVCSVAQPPRVAD